tara:strand:+ start:1030 stop:1614 length:585 start_codon:yes stop_codon:yes gene_type:complete
MIINLDNYIPAIANHPSDINEHIPTIIKYGQKCNHITEMGVRGIISTWGWLASNPQNLISYDIQDPKTWESDIQNVYDTAEAYGIDFKFNLANVLEIEIEETDLLFLDTWHSYKQLTSELKLHASKVKKYICFHDTTSYATRDETSYEEWGDEWKAEGIGIWKAIEEFLESNPEWVLEKRFTNNNGFTIIKRIK